jgi:AAA domain
VTSGPIVYCALEGAQGHKNRIEAFRRGKISRAADSDPPFYLMATPLSLVRDQKAFTTDIGRQLGDLKPVAVCIDTLNRSLEGSESSDEDMSAYVRAADAIRDAFGCLVIIVHHCGHGGDRPRGHSSLMGALDAQIAVRRDATDNVVAELELSKDGETGLQFVSRLKVVEIGADQDGDPITSCVIEAVDVPAAAPKATAKSRRSDGVEIIKRALADAYARLADGVEPSPGFGGALVRKIPVERLRDEVRSRGFLETDDKGLTSVARKHFHRAKTDLIAEKRFIEADKLFWRLSKSQPEAPAEDRTSF